MLPRSDTLYLKGGSLDVDYYLTKGGSLKVFLHKEGESPDKAKDIRFARNRENNQLFSWDGTLGKKKIAPGNYVLTFRTNDGVSPNIRCLFRPSTRHPQLSPAGDAGGALPAGKPG